MACNGDVRAQTDDTDPTEASSSIAIDVAAWLCVESPPSDIGEGKRLLSGTAPQSASPAIARGMLWQSEKPV